MRAEAMRPGSLPGAWPGRGAEQQDVGRVSLHPGHVTLCTLTERPAEKKGLQDRQGTKAAAESLKLREGPGCRAHKEGAASGDGDDDSDKGGTTVSDRKGTGHHCEHLYSLNSHATRRGRIRNTALYRSGGRRAEQPAAHPAAHPATRRTSSQAGLSHLPGAGLVRTGAAGCWPRKGDGLRMITCVFSCSIW